MCIGDRMQSIWVPNDTWEAFIVRVMNDNGVDYPALKRQ